MSEGNIVDFESARARRLARQHNDGGEDWRDGESLEQAALRVFLALAQALEAGAAPRQVDRLIERVERLTAALTRS